MNLTKIINKNKEIEKIASLDILENLFQNILRPLFDMLLKRLGELDELFYTKNYSYQGLLTCVNNIHHLTQNWQEADFSITHHNPTFYYRLNGYKKGGPDTFDIELQLILNISPYSYGFSIRSLNNQQPFMKKMYHEELTSQDMVTICDFAIEYMTDDINNRLSNIQKNS